MINLAWYTAGKPAAYLLPFPITSVNWWIPLYKAVSLRVPLMSAWQPICLSGLCFLLLRNLWDFPASAGFSKILLRVLVISECQFAQKYKRSTPQFQCSCIFFVLPKTVIPHPHPHNPTLHTKSNSNILMENQSIEMIRSAQALPHSHHAVSLFRSQSF